MLRLVNVLRVFTFFVVALPCAAQAPAYEDIKIKADSITTAYQPASGKYVFVRSKRGVNGVNRTDEADSAITKQVRQIVLVFTETTPDAIADREEFNRERWENLMFSYPEFFQPKTTYKDVCQCNANGDESAFKQAQGFYIYLAEPAPPKPVAETPKPAETKPAEPKAAEPKAAETKPAKETKSVAEKRPDAPKQEPPRKEEPVKAEPPPVKPAEPEVAAMPPAAEEPPSKPAKNVEAVDDETAPPVNSRTTGKTRPVVAKPKKAKDPKACRPACYGFGDEDLAAFFKDNLTFTKKQKKRAKKYNGEVRLQLNVDGTIKRSMVTGSEPEINQLIEEAVKQMRPWNAAVKNGTTVRSDVRIVLKYDREWKVMKPFEVIATPKLPPKCKCVSDSEIFD